MTKDFIFKTLVLGFPSIGKTTFLNCNDFNDSRNSIGVSFQVINNIFENNLNNFRIRLQLWDFKTSTRFINYYPVFCRGASACILCFDVSDGNSFDYLHHWIRIVRLSEQANKMPIFLIGLKSDLNREVSNDQIYELTMQYNLDGIYFFNSSSFEKRDIIFYKIANYLAKNTLRQLSPNIRDRSLNYLPSRSLIYTELDELREIIANLQGCEDDDTGYLSREDKEKYYEFLDYFSACPICYKLLHISYLTKFYFNMAPENIKFKKVLIKLIDGSKNLDMYYNPIQIGIPCCDCYKKVF